MSRPAWMTDELDEEWVEPDYADDESDVVGETSQRSQRSHRSNGGSKIQRSPHIYGSVRVASSSAGSSSDMGGSMKERSVRDLLGPGEGGRHKVPAPLRQGAASAAVGTITPEQSPIAGTFLIREDVAPEPLKAIPAAFALKKAGVKDFFSPLALERMFEPPSPPANTGKSVPEIQPRLVSPPSSKTTPTSTQPTDTATTATTAPSSLIPSKPPSPGNTTPSPHASPTHDQAHGPSLSPSPSTTSSSQSQFSFTPSPSAGRGPLGTFRLPRNPHAPIRPSRLSESHLIKPYASFEGDDSTSSRSSLPKNVLGDMDGRLDNRDGQPGHSGSPSKERTDEDEERMTDDFDLGDDDLILEDDIEAEDADEDADSILDPTTDLRPSHKTEQTGRIPQTQGAGSSQAKASVKANSSVEPDEIIDTDIPNLALFAGRKLSSNYQFTFSDPRHESDSPQSSGATIDTPRKKTREDRKRDREEERERRNATRALLHPHDALRPTTPDVDIESRSTSRASSVDDGDRSCSPYTDTHTGQSHSRSSRLENSATPSRDSHRTPSPSMVPVRDPRLKLFHFQYDTFTRDHLSALVDSIAVGSVGSSPSLQVNTMEFRCEDPRALSTPSDAVRYAKKIKLTPPEEYSDWDGEQSAEEGRSQTEQRGGASAEWIENEQECSRPMSTGGNYADNARNLMLAMRAARSFEGESATSSLQQGDQEQDLSTESAATDYLRRGADLMAQIRGEMFDEDDGDGSGSGSVRDGSVSIRGGSFIIKSPGDVRARGPYLHPGPETQPQDPVDQLLSSIRAVRLEDQAQRPIRPSPRKLLRRLSAADEVSREVLVDEVRNMTKAEIGWTGLPQAPIITVSTATTPDPPRLQGRGVGRGSRDPSAQLLRMHTSNPAPTPTHSHLEPQHPSTAPTREDMNRFVSSSTVHTKTTTCSAGSFVKHAGSPASLGHSGIGVRQIAPTDLPAEALPDRVGRMIYDREAMRWRQEVADGNMSEGSEDPFKDFDSFVSGGGGDRSDDEGSAPMDEDDEQEQEDDTTPVGILDPYLTFEEPLGLSVVEEVPESGFDLTVGHDETVAEELPPVDEVEDNVSKSLEPALSELSPASPGPRSRIPHNLGADTTGNGTIPMRTPGPLRPALKSAASTPAQSAVPSRESTVDPTTPMPSEGKNRRSVSFSDGRLSGKIRDLSLQDGDSLGELTLSPAQSECAPSSRMQRIGNLLDELEHDSILENMSIAPGQQSSGESDEDTTEQLDMGQGDPDVDPDVSRNPRTFARTYSFGGSERAGSNSRQLGNATFLTECSFGVAHDRLIQLITDVHPYQPYWEPLGEINLSKKGIESLARLKEFLPNLDRLDVQGNELVYLSGVPTCLRELNVAKNQLTSLTSYAHLTNLEVLDISNNQVDSIAQLKCLRHLRELSAAGNTISDLGGIAQTTSLTKLNLKGNCLKSLSFEECTWPHVENIDLSGNGIKNIAGLSSLTTLVTLNLDHNALGALTTDGPLPRLRVLRLSGNKLSELDCSWFTNLRTLYADNNRLGYLRHADKAKRLENLSLRNQNGRGLHLSVADVRDVKRLYLSGNPLEAGFLEVPCYNLIYLELAACRLSTLPTDLAQLVPNIRVLNLNYNFLSDVRPLDGLVRLRKLTIIGSRLKATKPLLRSLQSMKEIEMLDFRMNPFSLGWYLPLLVRDVPGALQPSETTGKHDASWSDLDIKFRRDLPDELYIGRLAYRGLIMRVCTQLRFMDGIEITAPERAKAQKLLAGIEKSHKAKLGISQD